MRKLKGDVKNTSVLSLVLQVDMYLVSFKISIVMSLEHSGEKKKIKEVGS